ncbi:hypothetical protein BD408DRAFT_99704 [Parasitella parasitica]|nr:hypothetical protein BD408DRAFT_99704 [Parasitella parasitica]
MQLLPNGQDVAILYFGYSPNLPLTYVGMIVFGILFLALSIRVFLSQNSRLFLLLLPLTALLQVAGYALRYECANNPAISLFIAMSIFLLLCANVIALVNYKTIQEVIVISEVETQFIVIGPKFAKIFYHFSMIASALQGVGGGIQSNTNIRAIGTQLTIAGSCVQLTTLILFLVCAGYIHRSDNYQIHVYGTGGSIATREWTYYVFDALMIALCLIFYFVLFIGNYLVHHNETIDKEYNAKEDPVVSEYIDLHDMNNHKQNHQQSPHDKSKPSTFQKVIPVLPFTRVIYKIIQRI